MFSIPAHSPVMKLRILRAFLALALAGLMACQPSDPMAEPVASKTVGEFGRWRARMSDRITADQWREFDLMVQEIKLRVTADKEATGSEAVEAAMRARIDGRTFPEVLAMGYEFKLGRLKADRAELAKALEANAQITSARGETASQLETLKQRQQARLDRLDAEIAGLEQRLRELRPSTGAVKPSADGGGKSPAAK